MFSNKNLTQQNVFYEILCAIQPDIRVLNEVKSTTYFFHKVTKNMTRTVIYNIHMRELSTRTNTVSRGTLGIIKTKILSDTR